MCSCSAENEKPENCFLALYTTTSALILAQLVLSDVVEYGEAEYHCLTTVVLIDPENFKIMSEIVQKILGFGYPPS